MHVPGGLRHTLGWSSLTHFKRTKEKKEPQGCVKMDVCCVGRKKKHTGEVWVGVLVSVPSVMNCVMLICIIAHYDALYSCVSAEWHPKSKFNWLLMRKKIV